MSQATQSEKVAREILLQKPAHKDTIEVSGERLQSRDPQADANAGEEYRRGCFWFEQSGDSSKGRDEIGRGPAFTALCIGANQRIQMKKPFTTYMKESDSEGYPSLEAVSSNSVATFQLDQ
ncbi:hypothetical protein NEOLEDRAFT_1146273 [Neolentinus lepideus HHB14362 ss-1]|uniref:Uncharacterized protein n=1 Tax=Neolentinus lepideus HHB14362 ss-1 TaxID=1314782 RepID=A0A165UAA9_9AGAM|nr:hypothetical protein NEOLEDRAFT_1146273 [Neolentinus lepideus HHB14362 ss-1]